MNAHDPVNWPAHYIGEGGLQAIQVIEDWGLGFHLGNALKYIIRAPRKGNMIEDCKKAIWYLERARLPDVVKTIAIENAPFAISRLDVDVDFKVPHGALRDALDHIFHAALAQTAQDRAHLLSIAAQSVRSWISPSHQPEAAR